jgi:uncharacterized membrane protein YdjX (TVP38/TMEM64 family)
MSKLATKLALFAMIAALALLALSLPGGEVMGRLTSALSPARDFYSDHPVLCVLIFCLMHLTASILSLPGGCTLLNVSAGAVFGFWRGCAIVYPVTLLSASLVYFVTARFSLVGLGRFQVHLNAIREHLDQNDYFYLVSLRLSPLLPFGPLNAALGFLRVPFPLFFLTTLVGIFFDVTLLNSLGAGLSGGTPGSEKTLAVSFAVLFIIFLGLRSFLRQNEAK